MMYIFARTTARIRSDADQEHEGQGPQMRRHPWPESRRPTSTGTRTCTSISGQWRQWPASFIKRYSIRRAFGRACLIITPFRTVANSMEPRDIHIEKPGSISNSGFQKTQLLSSIGCCIHSFANACCHSRI